RERQEEKHRRVRKASADSRSPPPQGANCLGRREGIYRRTGCPVVGDIGISTSVILPSAGPLFSEEYAPSGPYLAYTATRDLQEFDPSKGSPEEEYALVTRLRKRTEKNIQRTFRDWRLGSEFHVTGRSGKDQAEQQQQRLEEDTTRGQTRQTDALGIALGIALASATKELRSGERDGASSPSQTV
ncbi:hypothetical protein B7494_g7016, partial [Chlorociboria aeruginascens]